jgi:DNA-binding LytR/AlgR family response regulator
MAVKILIAEDEDLIRAEMQRLLQTHWSDAQVVALAEDGAHAVELYEEHHPDVAFLDIQMPGMTGLQAASLISERSQGKCQIIFATAYNEHALAAFEAGAMEYLLKPVKPERLQQVIAKIKQRLTAPSATAAPQDLAGLVQQLSAQLAAAAPKKEHIKWISASLGNTIKLIGVEDIIYFQSDHKYTRIVTAAGEALVRKPLREFLDELDGEVFKQIHRSTVVNLRAVSTVVKDGTGKGTAKFHQCKDEVDVSAAFMGVFREM